MTDRSFCRIGVFYDGSYVSYAQRYFFHNRKLGWLQLRPFHSLLESYIRTKEQGYANYRIVYAVSSDNYSSPLTTTIIPDLPSIAANLNDNYFSRSAGQLILPGRSVARYGSRTG